MEYKGVHFDPCPMCGGEVDLEASLSRITKFFRVEVECSGCGLSLDKGFWIDEEGDPPAAEANAVRDMAQRWDRRYNSPEELRERMAAQALAASAPTKSLDEKGNTMRNLDNIYTYHSPKTNQPERYDALRAKAKELAALVEESCPDSREKSLAHTKLEEAVMWANASIARNE